MVDACSSDPVLTTIVGADGSAGFADLGLHNVAHGDADSPGWRADVLGTSVDGVSFLPAGTSRRSPRLAEIRAFLHDAERAYAMVILAGGAVLSDAAGLGMAPDAGCVLLAVVEHRTRVSDLTEAQQALTLARANRVGLLMTQRTRRRLLPGGPPTTAVVKATRPASPAPVSPIIRPTTAEQGG
jgi:hypothetical protein